MATNDMLRSSDSCGSFAEFLPSRVPRIIGLIARPERGHYQITDDGRVVDRRNLDSYTEQDMMEWPLWQAYQQEIAERKASRGESQVVPYMPDMPAFRHR